MRMTLLAMSIAFGAACAAPQGSAPKAGAVKVQSDPNAEAKQLNALVDEYFERGLALNPIQATFLGDPRYNYSLPNFLSPAAIESQRVYERYWLDRVREEIDRSVLEGQAALTYDIFVSQREQSIAGEKFPGELIPISQFWSIPNFLAQLGSGRSAQPFRTVKDYEDWVKRARAAAPLMDQLIVNMREGMEKDVVLPRVIVKKILPQLEAHVVDDLEKSIFMMPTQSFPDSFSDEEKTRLIAVYRDLAKDEVIPAYRRLHDFLKNEYMGAARETHGYWDLPNGEEWYAYRVAQSTTTDLTPDELHQIGLDEVARIKSEMKEVMAEVDFDGTLEEFFAYVKEEPKFYYDDKEALLQGYRDLQAKVNALLPKLFDVMPRADYEVRAVEAFREGSAAGASYQPASPDGSRPGIFYVNTRDLRAQPKFGMETLSLHEASPGHHFQIAIAQEVESLPRFRRFGGYTALSEGWALYAESIGKELGMFTDPMSYYGRLSDEMLRAMRLVVDTGLHHKKWTREQAIEFMLENSSMAESDVVAEVERYMAIPGQALAYKTGQLAIQRMRDKAERELGDAFDVKDFHRQILIDGALPLDVLEAKIDRWIASKKTS